MSLTKRDYVYWHFRPKKEKTHGSNYPIITNVQATAAGLITWTTDILATSQVSFGTNPLIGVLSAFDGTLVTSHSVQLSDLAASTLYYFKVQSFYLDALSISDLYTFTTAASAVQFITLEDGTYILLEDGTKIPLES